MRFIAGKLVVARVRAKRGTLDYAGDVAKCRLGAFVLISVVCAICGKSVGEKT